MSIKHGVNFNFSEYVKEKPQIVFESDWDYETFDSTKSSLVDLYPTKFNFPESSLRYLGLFRNQPVFDRFLIESTGKVIIKLLERRLYSLAMKFIVREYKSKPEAFQFSENNWSVSWRKSRKKLIFKALCALFDQGFTVVAYNINTHEIYGIIVAGCYPLSEEGPNDILSQVLNSSAHCEDRLEYTLQTLDCKSFLKVQLLLASRKYQSLPEAPLAYSLIKGLSAWGAYCWPKSGVKFIIVYPERMADFDLYRLARYGIIEHGGKKGNPQSNIPTETCFLVKILCYEEDGWDNHRYHGFIIY